MNIGNLPEIDDVYEDDEVVFSQDGVHLAKTKAKNMGVGGAGLRYWKEDSEKIYRLVQNDGHKWVDNGRFAVAGKAEVIIKETTKTITDPHTVVKEGVSYNYTATAVDKRYLFRRLSNKRVLGGLCGYRFWGDTTTSRLPNYEVYVDEFGNENSHNIYLPGWALISTKKEDLIYQFVKVDVETGEEEVLQTINPLDEPYVNDGVNYYISGYPDPEIYEPLFINLHSFNSQYSVSYRSAQWAWTLTTPRVAQGTILYADSDDEWTYNKLEWGVTGGSSHRFPINDEEHYRLFNMFYKRLNGRYETSPSGTTIIDDGPVLYKNYDWATAFPNIYPNWDTLADPTIAGHISGYPDHGGSDRRYWVDAVHHSFYGNYASPKLIDMKIISYTLADDPLSNPFYVGFSGIDGYPVAPKSLEEYKWGGFQFAWLGAVENVDGYFYETDIGHDKDIFHYIWHDAGIILPAYYYTAINIGTGDDQYVFYSGDGNDTADPVPDPEKANFKVSRKGVVDATGYLINGKEIEGVQTIDVVPDTSMGPNPTRLATITTSADELDIYTPTPTFSCLYDQTTGVKIGTFDFKSDSTDVYAPSGGGGGGGNVELSNVYSPPDVYTQTQRICTIDIGTTHTDLVAPVSDIKSISVTPVGNSGTRIAYIDIVNQGSSSATRKNIYVPTDDKSNWFGYAHFSSTSKDVSSETSATYGAAYWYNYAESTGFKYIRNVTYRFDGYITFLGDSSIDWPDTNDEYLYFEIGNAGTVANAYLPIKLVRNHTAGSSIVLAVSGYQKSNYNSAPSVTVKYGLANATGAYTCQSVAGHLSFTALNP